MSVLEPAGVHRTSLEFPATEGFRSVGRLVLGGVAARFELPIDRVDDLLLAVDSLLMQEPAGDRVRLEAEATPSGLVVRLGPFPPGRVDDPGLRRVLSRLVETAEEQVDGDAATVELVVSAAYRSDGGA